jgi:hypothetical protein
MVGANILTKVKKSVFALTSLYSFRLSRKLMYVDTPESSGKSSELLSNIYVFVPFDFLHTYCIEMTGGVTGADTKSVIISAILALQDISSCNKPLLSDNSIHELSMKQTNTSA